MPTDPGPTESPPVVATVRVFIRRPAETVFDYFADLRNEPQYNPEVSRIAKTSPGPIRRHTTFEGSHLGLGRVTWRLAEYERPRHLAIDGRVGTGTYRWTSDFEPAAGGTSMIGRMEWNVPRSWRLLRPLLAAALGWNARRSFRRMAQIVEDRTPAPPSSAS
jgi:hypothetical protein